MKTSNTKNRLILFIATLLSLQGFAQPLAEFLRSAPNTPTYPFPIPIVAQPDSTMQEQAMQQAEELARLTGNPFALRNEIVVDLGEIPNGKWCYPLPKAKVISPYGNRGRYHTGVDLKTHPNDAIYAAFDGVIRMSQVFSDYGNCVIIRHPSGIETLYSHNSQNLVYVGQRVTAGQRIALTGRTGRATTEHLHFELRVGGRHYNPNLLFDHHRHSIRRHVLTFKKSGGVIIKEK